jgi:hypothetical protein
MGARRRVEARVSIVSDVSIDARGSTRAVLEDAMKGFTGYILIAVLLVVLGGVCLAVSTVERRMAQAEQSIATFQYQGLEPTLEEAERYFEYGSRLPWVGSEPLNHVRARKAALQYWQRRYDVVLPQQVDPVSVVPADNVELQLVVANALYRTGRAKATNRETTIEAVKAGIDAQLAVLRNAPRHETAAYNYEYLVRLRNELEDRRGSIAADDKTPEPLGEEGGPPPFSGQKKEFKVLVPLDDDEIGDPGKGGLIERKG